MGEIFHNTPQDIKLEFSAKCNHIIDTGTMMILKNKQTDKIIAGVGMLDLYDSKYKYGASQPLRLGSKHKHECIKMDKKALYETNHKYLNDFLKIQSNTDNM